MHNELELVYAYGRMVIISMIKDTWSDTSNMVKLDLNEPSRINDANTNTLATTLMEARTSYAIYFPAIIFERDGKNTTGRRFLTILKLDSSSQYCFLFRLKELNGNTCASQTNDHANSNNAQRVVLSETCVATSTTLCTYVATSQQYKGVVFSL